MSEAITRVSGGDDRVRADLDTAEVAVARGQTTLVDVEVTNVDEVIRAYHVDVLGLDADWVTTPDDLDLFPGERRRVQVGITLPEAFPSGRRRIAIEVTEPGSPDASAITIELDLVLDPVDALSLSVEPATLETGKTGNFVLTPVNTGNTTLDLAILGQDPERIVEVSFDPPSVHLVPGERGVVRATAVGKRPWFGMPLVRMLDFTVSAGEATATTTVALLQRPRISRRVMTIAGLVIAVTVFAFVIMAAFGNVAELNEANQKLLASGLGEDQPVGGRVDPTLISGRVTATTGGGIDGVAVELYSQANPIVPAVTTVTDTAGNYRFNAVPEDTYLLRFAVAGFGQVWYPNGQDVSDADPLEIELGTQLTDLDVELAGQPGLISGFVVGEEPDGALVTVQLPIEAIEGSDVEPVPPVVAAAEVDATGEFIIPDLPTPGSYELVVTKPGFAQQVSSISLGPGEQREGLNILLRRGDGLISGTVVDTAGSPIPGATIAATDGVSDLVTRTLSGEQAGFFELRDLPTPGIYTITASVEGFFAGTRTVALEAEQQIDDLELILTASEGRLSGQVRRTDGTPVGAVEVTVFGADVERETLSLSTGEVGTWQMTNLPVPGTYTVTFRAEGFVTQAVSVELGTGPESVRTGVDALLTPANAEIQGIVLEELSEVTEDGRNARPLGGVQIVLASTDLTRQTISAQQPEGRFGFENVPPGAYTLTFSRVGSAPQTLAVDLQPGEQLVLPPVILERQALITGVVRRQGIGEAGIGVVAYKFDEFPADVTSSTISGAGGRFELTGLDAPETYLVEFQVPAGGPVVGSRTVFLLPGQEVDIEVLLD